MSDQPTTRADLRRIAVAQALKDLRRGPGLAAADLGTHERSRKLLRVVAEALGVPGTSAEDEVASEALVDAIRRSARCLPPFQQVILNVCLNLDLSADKLSGEGDLNTRRRRLLRDWKQQHLSFGSVVEEPPSDTWLRTTLEVAAIESLATELTRRDTSQRSALHGANCVAPDAPSVLVVGGAVMDVLFRIRELPAIETATQADSLDFHPGGKGLNQAVATRRLGLDPSLVSVVGDDHFGSEIVAFLEKEGVRTDHLIVAEGQRSAVTGVISFPDGTSQAIGWKNAENLTYPRSLVNSSSFEYLISNASAVLLTLEPPIDFVQRVLEQINKATDCPPVLLLPSPPADGGYLSAESLQAVDVVVANTWELARLARTYEPNRTELEHALDRNEDVSRLLAPIVPRLHNAGVRYVCVSVGAYVLFFDSGVLAPPLTIHSTIVHESVGARDAFMAALAYRLALNNGGELTSEDIRWASSAMASAQSMEGAAPSMPRIENVERLMRYITNETRM